MDCSLYGINAFMHTNSVAWEIIKRHLTVWLKSLKKKKKGLPEQNSVI